MAILYLCLLCPSINIFYYKFWDFSNFYLNDMPIPESNSVSHNLSFCERQYCRRIWGRERQNQLTGDHLNKLTYHSNKIGRGWEIRTPIDSFGDCSPSRWTNPLYKWWALTRHSFNCPTTRQTTLEEETRFELAEVLPSLPFQDSAINHSAILPNVRH